MRPSPRCFFVHLLQVWVDSHVKYIKIHENPTWLQTSINTVNLDTIGTIIIDMKKMTKLELQFFNQPRGGRSLCNRSDEIETGPNLVLDFTGDISRAIGRCVSFICRRYILLQGTLPTKPVGKQTQHSWITVGTNNNCIEIATYHVQTWPRW